MILYAIMMFWSLIIVEATPVEAIPKLVLHIEWNDKIY